jgi:hypothetical protein
MTSILTRFINLKGGFQDLAPVATVAIVATVEDRSMRCWLIHHTDGTVASHSFCPPVTRVEVCGWYPGATVEPEEDVQHG